MTKEQILKKAIEKAVKNGWKINSGFDFEITPKIIKDLVRFYIDESPNELYGLIFSHSFAQAFWGGKIKYGYEWEYHLQIMVISKDPLNYLKRFLDD